MLDDNASSGSFNESQYPQQSNTLRDQVSDIENFFNLRCKNENNPMFCYYNVNHFRNKIIDIRSIITKCLPDVFVVGETKLDSTFTNAQFFIENYFQPERSDVSSRSGGLIEYVRKGIIHKRMHDYELKHFESIASVITANKKHWFVLSFYRTERMENRGENIHRFFLELSSILTNVFTKYENIILMGDINIDSKDNKAAGFNQLHEFMDVFSLRNLIKDKTCYFKGHESSLDIILTNKPRCFLNSCALELGVSDCHKMVTTSLRSHVSRMKPKTVIYRSLKKFDETVFSKDLKSSLDREHTLIDTNSSYDSLLNIFIECLDRHAPLKNKKVRGNQCSFMNKELNKAIMIRSALKSKYNKNKNNFNRANFKRQRNLCVSLRKKAIKEDFEKTCSNLKNDSKNFFSKIKPYLTDKGALGSTDITLNENGKLISNEEELVEILNDFYINIIKYCSGNPSSDVTDHLINKSSDEVIDFIIDEYKHHPSIIKIKESGILCNKFSFKHVTEDEVYNILISLNPKKSVGLDTVPPYLVKLSAEVLKTPFTKLVNLSITEGVFPSKAKIAAVLPLFKAADRQLKKNYRPVSILTTFSKVFETILKNQIVPYTDECLSIFVSAYRKNYSTQHVLIRLLEEWRMNLDSGKIVGAILMDLSKAFDCIPHDILIAKLNAYGFDRNSLKYIFSYLKGRRQCVKINGIYSRFLTILAGVPQGSILGPILFNLFINDIFMFILNGNLHGFADDQTISGHADTLEQLKYILCSESNIAINWLKENKMIVNPSKFQAIVLSKSKKSVDTIFEIDQYQIKSSEYVKLLGITIDDKLTFDEHVSKLCKRAGGQLNQLYRFKNYLSPLAKKLSINSFINSNFNYCPLVWNFMSASNSKKVEKVQERALRFLHDILADTPYEDLLVLSGKTNMFVSRLKCLCTEIYKTVNNLSPKYMKDIFYQSNLRRSARLKYNIEVQKHKQVSFGKRSLRILGPMIWNILPTEIKSSSNLQSFKNNMEKWGGENCPIVSKFNSYLMAS